MRPSSEHPAAKGLTDEQVRQVDAAIGEHLGESAATTASELEAAWRAAEVLRYDDPFAWRIMLRLGRALVAFHEEVRDARNV